MSCRKNDHRFIAETHTLRCTRCGLVLRAETCTGGIRLREPAGMRNPHCGFFAYDPRATAKQLWDQYRHARFYHVRDPFDLMEFNVPAWFAHEIGH